MMTLARTRVFDHAAIMTRAPVVLALALSAALTACGEEEPKGPPTSEIYVRNESSTEANVRVKFWTKDYVRVTSGDKATVKFVNTEKANAVQVEAKSRKQWDDCWVTMNVGQTLVVFDATERIGCRAE
ncbi:hypothetical protein BAL199_02179 [alpha proteobacterium BAL199]|jgi:hypothetical protein|nr:hypothetical protein BAL199_02179 [alpha proteobacterium BAL199]